MSDSIESFSALMKLERTSSLFYKKWPSNDTEKRWNQFISHLNSLSSEDSSFENLSHKKIELLQNLLDAYISDPEHDINIILRGGKRVLPQMTSAIPKLTINKIGFDETENEQNLLLLLNNIPKRSFKPIAIPLMKYYLNSGKQTRIIKDYIRLVFSSFQPSDAAYISNLEIFLSENELQKRLYAIQTGTYNDALSRLGIAEKYKSSLYFKLHFFDWISTLNEYSYNLIADNNTEIVNCTEDEKKIILARIIVYAHDSIKGKERDDFVKKVDVNFFEKKGIDKTEKEYWTIVSEKYKTEKNIQLLKDAHIYYSNIFTRFIITKFYDSLAEIASDRSGHARAEFWRKYGSSEEFVNIKLVLNGWQRREVFKGLFPEEARIFDKHCIKCDNNSDLESAVFVIIFTSKIIVDYVQNGHSGQVFNSENAYIKNLINRHSVINSREFNYFTTGSVLDNYRYTEGRILHNGKNWQRKTTLFLNSNGIYPGSD